MKQKKIIETMETAGWEDGVQQSVNACVMYDSYDA